MKTKTTISTKSELTVAAKLLAALAVEDSCQRCAWVRLHAKDKLPYQAFPSLILKADAYIKGWVSRYWGAHGTPPWLNDLGLLSRNIPAPSWRDFQANIGTLRVRGEADAIFLRPDGSIVIADYKLSVYSDSQSKYHPLYLAQLNIYADIYESINTSDHVSSLALIYLGVDDGALDSIVDHSVTMRFTAKVLPVERVPGLALNLSDQAATLLQQGTPPAASPSCQDCQKENEVGRLLWGVQSA